MIEGSDVRYETPRPAARRRTGWPGGSRPTSGSRPAKGERGSLSSPEAPRGLLLDFTGGPTRP